ncbi:serine/threonine-protein kinase PpkA [Rhodobacteraceae bacterium MBR-64]
MYKTLSRLTSLIRILAIVTLSVGAVHAQERRPLVLEGTSTIYERVLTRPGAELHLRPGAGATRIYPAFQPLYVFARSAGWLEVGPSASRAPEGWVSEDSAVQWKQNIVAAFTNASGRQRQLMFQTEDDLRALMQNEALAALQAQLVQQADDGQLPTSSGVVAVEPAEFVNIRDQLYLMPILDFLMDVHPLNYEETLLMKLASIPLEEEAATIPAAAAPADDFDAGVVFVLDTTQSMQPYIDRTQIALQRIVEQIRGTDVGRLINFGVVAFRDNNDAVPGLEYRTRELVPLARRDDQAPVLDAIYGARNVATANSPGFNEDSLAGVEDALDLTDWDQGGANPFDARYIILVTDAGPKDSRDPNARSAIGPAELQRDAEGRNVVIMTLHLKTPTGGEANHAYAAGSYRALSRFREQQYYYPIDGGSEQSFEDTVTRVVTALTDHLRVARGEETVLSPEEAGPELVELGRAMRLAYLGARQGTQAPSVVESWVSAQATENPLRRAFEPRLLVTKNELATMSEFIRDLARLGDQIQDSQDAANFFDQIQGVIARMAQNPDRLVNADANSVGGALEFLERLPYRSQLLQISQDDFVSSPMFRRPIVDNLYQKQVQYLKWLQDSSVWTPLYEGAPDGEYVFAMPFDVLP